jgi:hypothetical protein
MSHNDKTVVTQSSRLFWTAAISAVVAAAVSISVCVLVRRDDAGVERASPGDDLRPVNSRIRSIEERVGILEEAREKSEASPVLIPDKGTAPRDEKVTGRPEAPRLFQTPDGAKPADAIRDAYRDIEPKVGTIAYYEGIIPQDPWMLLHTLAPGDIARATTDWIAAQWARIDAEGRGTAEEKREFIESERAYLDVIVYVQTRADRLRDDLGTPGTPGDSEARERLAKMDREVEMLNKGRNDIENRIASGIRARAKAERG